MKLALFSPLNPIKTGISDYTEELLFDLKEHFMIDIYVDAGFEPSNEQVTSHFTVHTYDPGSFDPSSYDQILYHMGNFYGGHRYIYEALKKYPGVVVLHDYVMQGFYAERYEATGNFDDYRKLLVRYYGDAGAEIADDIAGWMPYPIWESEKSFDFPLNEEIVEHAKALIVHSDFVRKMISAKTDKPVVKINHHGHVTKNFDAGEIRQALGVNENDLLICSAGFINKNKRYDVILTALNEIENPRIKYLIVGKDQGKLLDNILDGKTANVLRRDHVPIGELEGLIFASDICINLRFPTMGESSGSLMRMMGYGKPVLVTNFGSYSEFPDYCVLKIDADLDEKEMIKRFVLELMEDPDFRSSIGREASEYVMKECGIAKCAREYAEFLRESG